MGYINGWLLLGALLGFYMMVKSTFFSEKRHRNGDGLAVFGLGFVLFLACLYLLVLGK